MNSAIWMLDAMMYGVWVGAELPRKWWVAVAGLAPIAGVGYWLTAVGAFHITNLIEIVPVVVIGIGAGGWQLYCNVRTYRDKLAMLEFLVDNPSLPGWWALMDAASEEVPYSRHILGYMTFRQPMKEYPAILQGAVERAPSLRELKQLARERRQRMRETHE